MSTQRAMSPADRALAISRSKAVAFRFVEAVKASDAPMVRLVTAGLSWEEMPGLALVLADAVDPMRLKAVREAEDDGMPAVPGVVARRPAYAGRDAA